LGILGAVRGGGRQVFIRRMKGMTGDKGDGAGGQDWAVTWRISHDRAHWRP
jgi:hypothetical protein